LDLISRKFELESKLEFGFLGDGELAKKRKKKGTMLEPKSKDGARPKLNSIFGKKKRVEL
jgi:hypothetical protein